MDRKEFFATLRRRGSGVFGTSLSQQQVAGVEAILDEGEKRGTSVFHLAAILSEIYHETGGQMLPVKETVYASSKDRNPSDAVVIQRLEKAFAKGQLSWVKTPYWRDGWFGRGLIQLTHKANYDKFGVTKAQALDLKTSVRIVFDGMIGGKFTGKKLSDYDLIVTKTPLVMSFRYYASRAIVNGDVAGNGGHIETYGKAFEAALRAAGYSGRKVQDHPVTSVTPMPSPKPATIEQGPSKDGNWLAALLAAVLAIFNRKSS
jgi:putative chitinase